MIASLQPLALSAAFWLALAGYRRCEARPPTPREWLVLVAGLALAAALAHVGWALLLYPGLTLARPTALLDPGAGYSLLFVPLGPWWGACALRDRNALRRHRVRALRSLPAALACARFGCLLAGCCGGSGPVPLPLYEIAGWLLLARWLRKLGDHRVPGVFALAFGGLRLLLNPLRAPPPLGPPLLPAWLLAGGWLVLGVALLMSPGGETAEGGALYWGGFRRLFSFGRRVRMGGVRHMRKLPWRMPSRS